MEGKVQRTIDFMNEKGIASISVPFNAQISTRVTGSNLICDYKPGGIMYSKIFRRIQ